MRVGAGKLLVTMTRDGVGVGCGKRDCEKILIEENDRIIRPGQRDNFIVPIYCLRVTGEFLTSHLRLAALLILPY